MENRQRRFVIKTGQIGKQSGVDTTVKSGMPLLAPTWDIVMGHKKGRITDEEYTEAYLKMLRDRWDSGLKKLFQDMLKDNEVTLLCYCRAGKFCHRHILADCLDAAATKWGYLVIRSPRD